MGVALPGFVAAPWRQFPEAWSCSLRLSMGLGSRWKLATFASYADKKPRVNNESIRISRLMLCLGVSKLTDIDSSAPTESCPNRFLALLKVCAQRLKKLPLILPTRAIESPVLRGCHEAYRTLIWPMGGN